MNSPNNPIDLPLRDIHLPDPISWWPLPIGWWIVAGGVFLLIIITIITLRRLFRLTLKKEATRILNQIEKTFQENQHGSDCIAALSILLRRIVITRHPKGAGVIGEEWLRLLDSPKSPDFSQGVGRLLLTAPYQPRVSNDDVTHLIQLCRKLVDSL